MDKRRGKIERERIQLHCRRKIFAGKNFKERHNMIVIGNKSKNENIGKAKVRSNLIEKSPTDVPQKDENKFI